MRPSSQSKNIPRAALTFSTALTILFVLLTIQAINTLWTGNLSTSGKISLSNRLGSGSTPTVTPFLPIQPGTRLKASITVAGFVRETGGEVEFTAQGDAASGIQGEICVSNEGNYLTENLSIENVIQAEGEQGPFTDLLTSPLDLGAQPVLDPGEAFCYPYEINFTPLQKRALKYRNTALITITNHTDWTPGSANCPGPDACPFGPTLVQDFELPVSASVTPTNPPPATITLSPTSDPSPTPTATLNAASETPDLTTTPSSTPRPTPTVAPTEETLEPSQTPGETPALIVTASPVPATMTATPTEIQAPMDTPTMMATPPADTTTPTASPIPTDMRAATSTSVPADTPTPAPILDLAVGVTDDEVSAVPGGVVIYSIYFNNYGDAPATGVTLYDTLPANTTFNPDSSFPGWTQVGSTNEYAYHVGELPARDSGVVNLAVTVSNPFPAGQDAITNTASIFDDGSNGPDANPDNNSASDLTPITNN